MVSSTNIWKKHAQVSFSKTIKIAQIRRTSAIWGLWKTHKCLFFQIARETMLLLINNIHDKIMQNWVIHLRHVQNNLFTSDCQYFHNEKTFVRTTEVNQCLLITKIVKISKIALYFLALTALLSTNKNWEIFSCISLIDKHQACRPSASNQWK